MEVNDLVRATAVDEDHIVTIDGNVAHITPLKRKWETFINASEAATRCFALSQKRKQPRKELLSFFC